MTDAGRCCLLFWRLADVGAVRETSGPAPQRPPFNISVYSNQLTFNPSVSTSLSSSVCADETSTMTSWKLKSN